MAPCGPRSLEELKCVADPHPNKLFPAAVGRRDADFPVKAFLPRIIFSTLKKKKKSNVPQWESSTQKLWEHQGCPNGAGPRAPQQHIPDGTSCSDLALREAAPGATLEPSIEKYRDLFPACELGVFSENTGCLHKS